jgi:hypothetical protein
MERICRNHLAPLSSLGLPEGLVAKRLQRCRGTARKMVKLMDELWAAPHGMATLYLDRSAEFDVGRPQDCVAKLLLGPRALLQRPKTVAATNE